MNPIPAALLTATITTLERWARGKGLTIDTVVGLVGIAVLLAVIHEINAQFAKALGVLVVVGTFVALESQKGPTLLSRIQGAVK